VDPSLATTGSTSIGNGPALADLQAYWTNHHPGTLPAGVTTRYQIYSLEIARTGNAGIWNTDGVEPHGPQCAPANTEVLPEYVASRRILNVAVVDCQYWNVHGNAVNDVTINTYANFFITKPTDQNGNIYTEYVSQCTTSPTCTDNITASQIHRIVHLVR
jgi:hypothetical protein